MIHLTDAVFCYLQRACFTFNFVQLYISHSIKDNFYVRAIYIHNTQSDHTITHHWKNIMSVVKVDVYAEGGPR